MIDKIEITKRLTRFFKRTNIESFFKIIIVSYLYDKTSYLEKIVGKENSIAMLDKYIYNLQENVIAFRKIEKYHSIYVHYNYDEKKVYYHMSNNYNKLTELNEKSSKEQIIKEFKIMIYKELEKVVNIHRKGGKIFSNGYYIEDEEGRYPEYGGHYSNIIDIFAEYEVCDILGINDNIIVYIDETKENFVYARHISVKNSQVMCYAEFIRKIISEKLFYFAMNNPKKYSKKMIDEFNEKYNYILDKKYELKLKRNDIFSTIESYLIHIVENPDDKMILEYHKDLTYIFEEINRNIGIKNANKLCLNQKIGINKI